MIIEGIKVTRGFKSFEEEFNNSTFIRYYPQGNCVLQNPLSGINLEEYGDWRFMINQEKENLYYKSLGSFSQFILDSKNLSLIAEWDQYYDFFCDFKETLMKLNDKNFLQEKPKKLNIYSRNFFLLQSDFVDFDVYSFYSPRGYIHIYNAGKIWNVYNDLTPILNKYSTDPYYSEPMKFYYSINSINDPGI